MVSLSYLCRYLSKHYFFKGDQKKFELFHKLSGIAGVASAIFELADMRSNKSHGAVDKIDAVESALKSTHTTISESKFKGGAYNDSKYDSIRERAKGTGRYIYLQMDTAKIYKLLEDVKVQRKSSNLSQDSKTKLSIMSMYIRDYLQLKLPEPNEDLFYCSIGSLHYYLHPLNDIPDYVPLAGYSDNMFVLYCVYAGYREPIEAYKTWRIQNTRTELEETAMQDENAVWNKITQHGLSILKEHRQITVLTSCQSKLNEKQNLGDEYKEQLKLLSDMFDDYIYGKYTQLSKECVTGILGTMGYFIQVQDILPDNISVEGYLDDEIVIKCCCSRCSETIQQYSSWKGLTALYEENDPLTEYLNNVVGKNSSERDEEVKRLAKMCTDSSIKDLRTRATMALAEII